MFMLKVVMRKQQVMKNQNCPGGKIWAILKKMHGKKTGRKCSRNWFIGASPPLYTWRFFDLVQQLPSAILCQIPFSHCLILDAIDSHLLLGIRIVSFWYLRFILNVYTNKNIHFKMSFSSFCSKLLPYFFPGKLDLAPAVEVWVAGGGTWCILHRFPTVPLCNRAGKRAGEA